MPDSSNITVFVSYAHEDKPYADVLFKELEKHSKSSNIKNIQWKTWVDDKDIFIGDQWRESIQNNVKTCDFALLLVSPDYLASDFIKIEEFNRFLERAKKENFIFFPILLRHCNFSQWEELAKRQFFMPGGADYGSPDLKNIAYADLVKFRESDGFPLPNSNLDRYHMELIDALENSIAAHLDVSMPDKEVESIYTGLKKGSRAYYDLLRGPNGRFRYLKISDILFTGTETKWLETNVDIDNEKFYGGPGPAARGADKSFTKEPPGCRRHSIIEVLPILWKSEVKHAVIVGEGGMGKTVSLIQW
ncbi:MAG: hypothetical protein QG657_370, partial [Acidobacteriota bacterium]|nr:hypothetical protein [Acidobacteriota bacterium]